MKQIIKADFYILDKQNLDLEKFKTLEQQMQEQMEQAVEVVSIEEVQDSLEDMSYRIHQNCQIYIYYRHYNSLDILLMVYYCYGREFSRRLLDSTL